jgi:hypothetical protein
MRTRLGLIAEFENSLAFALGNKEKRKNGEAAPSTGVLRQRSASQQNCHPEQFNIGCHPERSLPRLLRQT